LSLDFTELKLFQSIPDDLKLPIILPSIFFIAVKDFAKVNACADFLKIRTDKLKLAPPAPVETNTGVNSESLSLEAKKAARL
jgi:hypothetical protein